MSKDDPIRAEARMIAQSCAGDIHRLPSVPLPPLWAIYDDEQWTDDAEMIHESKRVTYETPPPMAARRVGSVLYVVEAGGDGSVGTGRYVQSEGRRVGARRGEPEMMQRTAPLKICLARFARCSR